MQVEFETPIENLSIVIPVNERGENLLEVLKGYRSNLAPLGIVVEYIVILAPHYAHLSEALEEFKAVESNVKFFALNRNYGEAGEIKIGIQYSQYEHILTLPPYEQIEPSNLPAVLGALLDNDLIVVNRSPRIDPISNKIQSRIFRGLLEMLAYNAPKDPGSGVRLARKEVFNEIPLYGDLHRFVLILAENAGFKTASIDIPQSRADAYRRVYSLRTYLVRFLDILTVVFLSRFNKKPLRFFGVGGALSSIIGILGLVLITVQKLFFGVPAGDRPLLILCSLFLVLGVQLIAIGLVGETVIFTNAKDNKEYRIRRIIN